MSTPVTLVAGIRELNSHHFLTHLFFPLLPFPFFAPIRPLFLYKSLATSSPTSRLS